jgi:Helix-turn-helix domain of resolvase.
MSSNRSFAPIEPSREYTNKYVWLKNVLSVRFRTVGLQTPTNEGRQEAKLKGIRFGRRRTIDRSRVLALHHKGTGATEIARQLGIARSTVYKILEDKKVA